MSILTASWLESALAPPAASAPPARSRAILLSAIYPTLAAAVPLAPAQAPPPLLFENELADFIRAGIGINAYPMAIPSSVVTYPQLCYTVIDGGSEVSLDGPTGMAWRVVQIDAYSPKFSEAAATSERLRKLFIPLMARSGPMGRVLVSEVLLNRPATRYTPPVNGQSSSGMNRYLFEYTFYFYESLT